MKNYLLLGCGNSRDRRIKFNPDQPNDFSDGHLVAADIDLACKPDIYIDLDDLAHGYGGLSDTYDEIHAYDCLEHCGRQGDGEFFFAQFNELHRMLKPAGILALSVPLWDTQVQWGVPDHKRCFPPASFGFLEKQYYDNVGKPSYGDYRRFIKGYWTIIHMQEHRPAGLLYVALRADK